MQRGIITAPAARDLSAEADGLGGHRLAIYKLPRATNGVLQGWSTSEADRWAARGDAALTIYLTIGAVPPALRKYLFVVRRADDLLGNGLGQKLWADLGALDYVRTWSTLTGTVNAPGALTRKLSTAMLGTDRFLRADTDFAHSWQGTADDDLGDTN